MKKILTTLFVLILLSVSFMQQPAKGDSLSTVNTYKNHVIPDFHPDPTIYRVGIDEGRKNISLDGTWDIAESLSPDKLPYNFVRKIPVPGLVDMASPMFDSTGVKSSKRNYYWYGRFFTINDPTPSVVLLKINKAIYGTAVYINGKEVGSNFFCFTPTLLNIRDYLKPPGEQNELVIRVGAYYDNVPDSIPVGIDIQKIKYIPGIYDNVGIILSNYPFIENVQIAPDINKKLIRVQAEINSDKDIGQFTMDYFVTEYKSGKEVISGKTNASIISSKSKNIINFTIPIKSCHLWNPEDPFLYSLNLSTGKDSKTTRFGMRSFKFDKDNNHAILNGKPYSMLGTNICFFRFLEDSSRGDLPWNEKWVRKLFQVFKGMNCNSLRFNTGFPPEKWYQIADETGFLIMDEYPIWGMLGDAPKANVLVDEYTRWMRERWNHPCVVIWDAQNETVTKETGKAIQAVRYLDLSNRPWDNGWAAPQSDDDCIEEHPYLFGDVKPSEEGYLKDLFGVARKPDNGPDHYSPSPNGPYKNACVIDEYDWLWLNRDGSPTTASDSVYASERVYRALFGSTLTTEERRIIHAENMAIVTEYWRCHRSSAALMYFCGLSYSRPNSPAGYTSDDFIDVKNLELEPYFERYMKREFEAICIMIDKWDKKYQAGEELKVPVYVINDLQNVWIGTLTLTLQNEQGNITVLKKEISIPSFGRTIVNFKLNMPFLKGSYSLIAETLFKNEVIKSSRKFLID